MAAWITKFLTNWTVQQATRVPLLIVTKLHWSHQRGTVLTDLLVKRWRIHVLEKGIVERMRLAGWMEITQLM